ncbi:MAG: hypothetical protein ACMXX7_00470 [Candidatus Woesearchaeota archaeon]
MKKLKEFYNNFKAALLGDKNFYSKLEKEKSLKKGFVYFVVLTFFFLIISTQRYLVNFNTFLKDLYESTGIELFNLYIPMHMNTIILFYVSVFSLMIILSFARFGLVHLFIKIFNKKAKYKDTYNSLSFSITPGYVGVPFLVVGLGLMAFTKGYLFVLGIISMIAYVLIEIYAFYIRAKALSDTQKISLFKSFLAIYVFSPITLLLIIATIQVIILTIYFLLLI